MGKFKKDKKSSGRRDFGGMHKAICDECGQSCEVPFRPTEDKPIYCNNCFANKRGGDSRGPREVRRERSDRPMFSAVCSACGAKCQVPFQPTNEKPVYCDECFEKNKRGGLGKNIQGGKGNDGQFKSQIDALNAKLDKILKILAPNTVEPVVIEKPVKQESKETIKQESKKAIKQENKETIKQEGKKEIKQEKPAKKEAPVVKKAVKKAAAKKNPSKKLGAGK